MTERFTAPVMTGSHYAQRVGALLKALFATTGAGSSCALADAQLALYTVDGISEVLEWNNDGVHADELACIWLAYTRWLRATGHPVPDAVPYASPRSLDSTEVMAQTRGADAQVISILVTGEMQLVGKPATEPNASPSALLPVAMLGILPVAEYATVISLAAKTAALTHDDEAARASAVSCALLVRSLLGNPQHSVHDAVLEVRDWLADTRDAAFAHGTAEVLEAVNAALSVVNAPLTLQKLTATFGQMDRASHLLGATLMLVMHGEHVMRAQGTELTEALSDIAEYDRALTQNKDTRLFALCSTLLALRSGDLPEELNLLPVSRKATDVVLRNWLKQLGIASH